MTEHNLLDIYGAACKDLVTMPPEKLADEIASIRPLGQTELTLTFTDKWLRMYTAEYIQKEVYKFMKNWQSKTSFEWFLAKDYSKTLRLHYHGIIWFNDLDKVEQLRLSLNRKFGRCELKQISFQKEYCTYMLGVYIKGHQKYNPVVPWNKNSYIYRMIELEYILLSNS